MHPEITRSLAHERQRQLIDEAQQARAAARRPRRRTRRAVLAAVLPAAVAAFVLPAAADAATTVELSGGTLSYRADAEKTNTVAVRDLAGAVEVRDLRGVTARGVLCVNVDPLTVRCGLGTQRLSAFLGDRNDSITIRASFPADIDGGPGEDTYIGAFGPEPTRVRYIGGAGRDTADYVNANRGIRLSNDGAANDGRPGFDQDNIGGDVERLTGTLFGDELTGAGGPQLFGADNGVPQQRISGGAGDDVLRDATSGDRVFTTFEMSRNADGADRIIGGPGRSFLDYSERTRPVNVTLNFGGADDGEPGERDEITGSNELVSGGHAGDTILAPAGSTAGHELSGRDGNDRIEGADGPDILSGGAGVDSSILGNGGNDLISAKDGLSEIVGCGSGIDKVDLDANDGFSSCENFGPITLAEVRVGTLRLTPQALRVNAGQTARLKLSWSHPRSWRQLRRVELRLYRGDARVGAIAIRPRGKQIKTDGEVHLVRKRTRLTRKAKTVTAQLAVRLDESLAGQSLRAEVQATDTRGRRQLERGAGTVRVAG